MKTTYLLRFKFFLLMLRGKFTGRNTFLFTGNICDDFYGYARNNKILKHKWWSRYKNRLLQDEQL